MIIEHADNDMRCQLDLNWMRVSNDNSMDTPTQGHYTMIFHKYDVRGKGSVSMEWADTDRNKLDFRVSERMTLAIRQFACNNGYRVQFWVTGCTSIKLKTCHAESPQLFHASKFCHGMPWYNYEMIKYVDDNNTVNHSPSQILGFFHYTDQQIPTPKYKDKMHSLNEVQDHNMKDDTMYAVVHSATKPYINWERMQSEFVVPFQLANVKDHLYIVDVKTITDAIYVFKDYGGSDSNKRFCVLPYCLWGEHFSHSIYVD
mgnify:CR=1 FL=1